MSLRINVCYWLTDNWQGKTEALAEKSVQCHFTDTDHRSSPNTRDKWKPTGLGNDSLYMYSVINTI
jgi:hypothetical protein